MRELCHDTSQLDHTHEMRCPQRSIFVLAVCRQPCDSDLYQQGVDVSPFARVYTQQLWSQANDRPMLGPFASPHTSKHSPVTAPG